MLPIATRSTRTVKSLGAVTLLAVLALLSACSAPAPTPTPEPTIESDPGVSDSMRAVKECMEEAGFVMEFDGMGGLVGEELPVEQAEQWRETNTRCMEESGSFDPYSVEQLNELYDLEVENYHCLVGAGYFPDEPPSRQQFIDTWGTIDTYQAVATAAVREPDRGFAATQACPPPRWSFG